MTFEEIEQSLAGIDKSLKGLRDNQEVQGAMLWRTENNLDRLEAALEHLADGQASLLAATKNLSEVVASHESQSVEMRAAMHALFERMDRFIRGLESNGHKTGGET